MPQLKILCATTKTWCSQINKYFWKCWSIPTYLISKDIPPPRLTDRLNEWTIWKIYIYLAHIGSFKKNFLYPCDRSSCLSATYILGILFFNLVFVVVVCLWFVKLLLYKCCLTILLVARTIRAWINGMQFYTITLSDQEIQLKDTEYSSFPCVINYFACLISSKYWCTCFP